MAGNTRYSDEDLKEFKELIEGKIEKTLGTIQFYKKQLEDLGDNDDSKVKGLDDGTITVETETISTQYSRQKKYLKHLQNALIRIENKVYGVCRETGKLISKERLRAVPHATLSVDAKNARK